MNEDPYGEGWLVRIRLSDRGGSETACSTPRRTRRTSRSCDHQMSSAGYLSLTDADRDAMLEAIGVASLEGCSSRSPRVSSGSSTSPPPSRRRTLVRHLEELAARNADTSRELSFLGMGIYDHYVPASSTRSSRGASSHGVHAVSPR